MFTLVYVRYLLNLYSLLENKPNSQFGESWEDEGVLMDALALFGSVFS